MTELERNDRLLSAVILAAAVVLFAILALPLFMGQVYVYNDLGYYHLPLRDFYQKCLQSGDSFLWMPSILCGYYMHGEGQAGMCHPLHWVFYRFLPLGVAFDLELLLSYPFMFLGLYLFLRRWALGRSACLFGALCFTFSGFCLLHSIHLHLIQVIAHVPWLLIALDQMMAAKTRGATLRACACGAVLTASQMLIGFPQAVYFSVLVEGAYWLLLLKWPKGEDRPLWWRGTTAFVAAKLVAVLLAGVQLAPTVDLMIESDRQATPAEFRDFFSLHPANLLQFIGPEFFQRYIGMNPDGPKQPHEAGLYAGAAVTLLCVLLLSARARREAGRSGPLATGALVLGGVGLLLALGKYGGLYPLVSKLPLVSAFRSPCRHIVLVHLAMSVLAAVAFDWLHRQDTDRRAWGLLVYVTGGWLVAGYLAGGLAGYWSLPSGMVPFLSSPKELCLAPLVLTVAAFLVLLCLRTRERRVLPMAALVVFVAVDLGWYAVRYPATEPAMSLAEYKNAVSVPPGPGRAYGMVNNLMAVRGIDNCTGYIAPVLKRRFTYEYGQTALLRLAGVRWADRQWPRLGGPGEWSEIPEPLPYVRLLSRTYATEDPLRDIDKVNTVSTALTETPVPLPESVAGEASLIEKRPGLVRVGVHPTARQLLAVAESWHSGWRAEVDGHRVPVMRVNGDFLGCVVDPGASEVRFQFAPLSFRIGCAMTAVGVILVMLVGVTSLRERRTY